MRKGDKMVEIFKTFLIRLTVCSLVFILIETLLPSGRRAARIAESASKAAAIALLSAVFCI